jgi:hypothetical protein
MVFNLSKWLATLVLERPMKSLSELEALEKLQHQTGLTGELLLDKYDELHGVHREPPLYDYNGGPIHPYWLKKVTGK